jgi:putative acetyltransferase
MIEIRQVDPADEEVQALIEQLDAYQAALYPAESNHLDPLPELKKANVYFAGAFLDGRLVGTGAVKKLEGYGEIKRMFVLPECRGKGLADSLLQKLENHLTESEIFTARLETGIHQRAAIAFYERHGYSECGPFGAYQPDPRSRFMEKHMTPTETFDTKSK